MALGGNKQPMTALRIQKSAMLRVAQRSPADLCLPLLQLLTLPIRPPLLHQLLRQWQLRPQPVLHHQKLWVPCRNAWYVLICFTNEIINMYGSITANILHVSFNCLWKKTRWAKRSSSNHASGRDGQATSPLARETYLQVNYFLKLKPTYFHPLIWE